MAFSPFTEASIIRTAQPISGGINTSQVDKFRQGVSVKTEKHRFDGALPRLSTTRNLNHQIEPNVFGQYGTFINDKTAFSDKNKFESSNFITSRLTTASIPQDNRLTMDGAIEPLTIRAKINRFPVENPYYAYDIRGSLMRGNEDEYLRSDQIISFIPILSESIIVPFVDVGGLMGSGTAGIKLPGTLNLDVAIIKSFDDGNQATLFSGAPGSDRITNNSLINEALQSMTGSYDRDFRPLGHKSATNGFVYYNNPEGTDSLAFGGLKRS